MKKKNNGTKYALKVLEKDHILKYDKIDSVFRERDLGQELSGHPNIVEFQATFQDADNLYFLLEYCSNGSLSGLLKYASKSNSLYSSNNFRKTAQPASSILRCRNSISPLIHAREEDSPQRFETREHLVG